MYNILYISLIGTKMINFDFVSTDATVDITFNNNATFVRKTDSKKKSSERKKNTVVVKGIFIF